MKKGIGWLDVLALIFITLKLCGVISWSWVWVLSPLWISGIVIFLLVFFIELVKFDTRG
jgi:hypothetical protein